VTNQLNDRLWLYLKNNFAGSWDCDLYVNEIEHTRGREGMKKAVQVLDTSVFLKKNPIPPDYT
jgi:hypothetical protein